MSWGECQRNTPILETHPEEREEATSWLAGKLKPQPRNERVYHSGCFIKGLVVMTLTNSLDPQSRASGTGKLFIMDYWTRLRLVSWIQLEFFLTLPPSTGTSGNINCLLALESLLSFLFRWFLTSLGDHTYSGFVFWIVPNLVSQSQMFPSWVPVFLISFSPSNFPMKPLWESNSFIY